MTVNWDDLPEPVQDAVQGHLGPVTKARTVPGGQNCDVAVVVESAGSVAFLKGVEGVSRRMRFLRNEIGAGRLAVGVAPAVLFSEDIGDWLVVGFEYVRGRDASLAPQSSDLERVGTTVEWISTMRAPHLRTLRDRWSPADSWDLLAKNDPTVTLAGVDADGLSRWSVLGAEMVDGDRLVHTDLHGGQFLVGDKGKVRVVDWGWPAAGAEWVDTSFLVIRLIEAGHDPEQAEAWGGSLRSWSNVDDTALTAFAVYVAGLWTQLAGTGRNSGAVRRAKIAREYASWRLAASR